MTEIDREFFVWADRRYSKSALLPLNWKQEYANHLLDTKTKTQIWKMLCGPIPKDKTCLCKCPCPAGLAWAKLVEQGSI